MATIADVAEHLDVSEETVRQLKKRGIVTAAARGQIDLAAARLAYIRHLREKAAGRSSDASGDEGLDLVLQRARLASVNASMAELKYATQRGELVPIAAVNSAVIGLVELSKAHLLRLPAKLAGSDVALRARIQEGIAEALEGLSLARVEEITGDDSVEDDEDPDGTE